MKSAHDAAPSTTFVADGHVSPSFQSSEKTSTSKTQENCLEHFLIRPLATVLTVAAV